MPHVNIKHFPASVSKADEAMLVEAISKAVGAALKCDEGVISIAMEPVEKEMWNELVYRPEIIQRKNLLCKAPNY